MRWLNPWALLGLLAVALPLLVHLFSRRQARVMRFPTLQFLTTSRLLPTRRTRLSDVPLLVLRIAIVALAAIALAQPTGFGSPSAPSGNSSIARAIMVPADPVLGGLGATSLAAFEPAIKTLEDSSNSSLRIPAVEPREALSGAVQWLRTQPGLGEIVIVGDRLRDALDSVDMAGIPADIGVAFRPAAALSGDIGAQSGMSRGRVVWLTDASAATADGVRRSVQQVGAGASDVRVIALRAAYADTVRALATDTIPTIIVASAQPGALAQLAPSRRAAQWDPWMATVLQSLAQDTTLASTAPTVPAFTDTTTDSLFGAPGVVLSRTTSGTPIIVATASRDGDGTPQLFIVSHAPAAHLHTAALLLAATSAFAPPSSTALTVDTQPGARGVALRDLQRLPSARTGVNDQTSVDVESSASRGRYVWLAVLLLLGIEWLVRRYSAWGSAAATPAGER